MLFLVFHTLCDTCCTKLDLYSVRNIKLILKLQNSMMKIKFVKDSL